MDVLLYNEVTFVEGLEYKKACELLEKAGKSKAAQYFNFSIAMHTKNGGWSLEGRPTEATRAFVKDPKSFVIKG